MTWWCSAIEDPWSWTFRAYPGIWLMVAVVVGGYALGWARHRPAAADQTPEERAADRRRVVWFALGAATLWLATDWPLGTLGSAYLASAHMVQYMLYTLVAGPLLLLGTPPWMARALVDRLHLRGFLRVAAKPVVAGVAFNVILIATHAPWTVDTFRASQFGSMALDLAWIASGLLLWLPVISPLPELRAASPAVRCVYLFLAAAVVPMIPGGFLTFAQLPLYATYELAPRVHDLTARDDQQMAGILMKVGNIPVVWTVIFVIFARWALVERDGSKPPTADRGAVRAPRQPARAAG